MEASEELALSGGIKKPQCGETNFRNVTLVKQWVLEIIWKPKVKIVLLCVK